MLHYFPSTFQPHHIVKSLSADFRFPFGWWSYQLSVSVALCFFEGGGRGGGEGLFYKLTVKTCSNELDLANSPSSIELSRLAKLWTLHMKGGSIFWNLLWLKLCCSSEGIVCISLHKIMNTGAVSCELVQQSCPILVGKVIKVRCSCSETNSMAIFKGHASVLARI